MSKESHENLPLVDFLPKPGPGLRGLLTRLLRPIGHWLLRLRKIERHERNITRRLLDGELPAGASYVREFELEVDFDPSQLEHIPEEGPVIVTANHPLGGHDAMALLALVEQRRPDVKVLANRLLGKMRFLNDAILEVDVLGDSPGANRSTMREVVRFVRDGGALIVLPAGAVSHLHRKSKVVTDDPWTAQIGVLARLTKATIVPAFIGGRNSTLFQMAGLVHPILRTLLLPHELVRSTGMRFPVRIGEPVPPARVAKFESPEDLVEYLRALTYLLADRRSDADDPESSERAMSEEQTSWASIATAPTHSGEELQQELDALGSDARLISQSNLEVWCARAGDIPRLMLEVGRLRESAFRNVGEGSGRALDLDRYDGWYWQLLLWDREKQQLAGGYRLGMTDEILPGHGLEGLYTHSLFDYDTTLIERISPAIELGRSYVREEYQRKPTALLLLWRAIGAFVVLHPDHHRLFGPVSISNEFTSMSRQLLIAFLQTHRAIPVLSELVRPRNPMKMAPSTHWDEKRVAQAITDPEDLDALVRTIESGKRSMPILLRQYLKLDAKLLAANVDQDFGDVLDGLMYADMLHLDRRVMRFFVGEDGMERFLTHHGIEVSEAMRKQRRTRRRG